MIGYSIHELRAALAVARVLDRGGNELADVRGTYSLLLTAGEQRSNSLLTGEQVLEEAGLLLRTGGRATPSAALSALARLDDGVALRSLERRLAVLQEKDDWRAELGDRGEQAVVGACAGELVDLGYADLAAGVQRISLIDDGAGYDVLAPSIEGPDRQLEVKTTGRRPSGAFRFYLSRNEYDAGRRAPDSWSLVACHEEAARSEAAVLGWCRAAAIAPYLPEDRAGRWTEALVHLPVSSLQRGVPPAV